MSFGQNLSLNQQKKVLFEDVKLLKDKTLTIAKVIDFYTEMGLEMVRFKSDNNSIFKEYDDGAIIFVFKYIFASGKTSDHYFNAYGLGLITKHFRVKSKDYNAINNIYQIETEIVVDEMPLLDTDGMWKKNYIKIKSNFINEFNNLGYDKIKEEKSYDFTSPSGHQYYSIDNFVFKDRNSINNLIYRFVNGNDATGKFDQTVYYSTYFQSSAIELSKDLAITAVLKEFNLIAGDLDLRTINNYDLKAMINFFLEDAKKYNILIKSNQNIKAIFEPLEGSTIALAYGSGDDSNILIKVDPEKWATSSEEKRWYILYHELGHDVLNLDHGEGGKMMFNFADREYSWDEFIEDKKYMFENN